MNDVVMGHSSVIGQAEDLNEPIPNHKSPSLSLDGLLHSVVINIKYLNAF